MKEKILKNFSLKILSAIGALILWTIIVNIYDPTTSVTISNVAVELQNTESLTDNDYTYEVVDGSRISVYISGPKSVITELRSSDIVATADLSKITAFADYVDIDVKVVKDGRELNNVEVIPRTTAVKLSIENRLTKEFTIKYYTDGNLGSGYIVGGVSVFPDTVKVTGSSSSVGQISSANVTLNTAGKIADFTENVPIYLLDSDGNVIEDESLVLSRGDADCAVTINQTKTVKVSSQGYSGTVANNYLVRGVELSVDEAVIEGPAPIVGAIEEIVIPSSALDVTGNTSSKTVSVNLADYVDSSVTFTSETSVTLTARIVNVDSKEYNVAVSKITMNNLSSGLAASVVSASNTIEIAVRNDDGDYTDFTADNISLSVNLASLSVGEHIVTLNVTLPTGYTADGTYRVKVVITENRAASASTAPTQQATTDSARANTTTN